MKKAYNIIAVIIILLTLSSCLSPYTGDDDDGLPEPTTPIVNSDLFIPDNSTGKNVYTLNTNDPKYRTPSGYTLWTITSDALEFNERTIIAQKPHGSSIAGYGMIICYAQRTVGDSQVPVFLTVMVNNNKQYAIGKIINASYNHLVHWTEGQGLLKGVGLTHKIKVVRDKDNPNKYNLYINDVFERTFTDDEVPRCEGMGRNGLIVVIAPSDLNNSSVEVRFEEEK